MGLPGWQRLPGSAERYRNPRGEIVSRRQYENARVHQYGWHSWSEYQRTRKSDEYNRLLNRSIDERGLTRRDIGPGSDFSQLATAVNTARASGSPDLYDPDGPLADLLVYAGLRDDEDWWDVGDTPGETN